MAGFFNDPQAPSLRPQPGRFDAQPQQSGPPDYSPNGPADYYNRQMYGDDWQNNPQYLQDKNTFSYANDPKPGQQGLNGTPYGPDTGINGKALNGGSVPPYTGAPTDRNAIKAWFTAIGVPDPEQWTGYAMDKGGINDQGGYWIDSARNTGAIPGGSQQPSGGGQAGGAAGALGAGMGGDLLTPYTNMFKAPTGTDDPGFSFALNQGLQGIERGAAARGTLLTGGTVKDELAYATGSALQNYDQAFNRARQTWDTNYGLAKDNQDRPFNKLYQTANMGLNATQDLSNSYDRNTSFYNDATNPENRVTLGLNQGNINGQNAINQGNALNSYANIGGTLANNWFNRPRNTATV